MALTSRPITDESVPADAPHYKRIEYQETTVVDVRGARAFARATYDEWVSEVNDAENQLDLGTATTTQAA